jgi:hypothetical protein
MNFHGKTFKVLRNDGPEAEVTVDTIFSFTQFEREGVVIVTADYAGGGVLAGKLLGVLQGNTIRHSYVQVNRKGEFHRGQGTDEIELTPAGKIQLIDRWQWESRTGSGVCILEEF